MIERTHQDENTLHGQERLTIGQMAQRSGINAKAIRYYESIGLLPKAPRSANGYRSFCQADLIVNKAKSATILR
ncbi:hypothetical protein KSC_019180 [Ktedonobacter sp. SOSP1-52]|nr:MerR family DNA-binding transcriptional regulator [Ktedonobacter sp. SOSP1-52]GHO63026.1 hypothetical protein KSC_019180 [Ktedonobacter sp. SOSP1-52]